MRATVNLDLVEFHVREAAQELDRLLDAIQYAKDEAQQKSSVGKAPLYYPLREGTFAASLEHAYHHLNFAWNARFKTMYEADAQFSRTEKFPRPKKPFDWFERFWPKSIYNKSKRRR